MGDIPDHGVSDSTDGKKSRYEPGNTIPLMA